jgi:hypothetical protein
MRMLHSRDVNRNRKQAHDRYPPIETIVTVPSTTLSLSLKLPVLAPMKQYNTVPGRMPNSANE